MTPTPDRTNEATAAERAEIADEARMIVRLVSGGELARIKADTLERVARRYLAPGDPLRAEALAAVAAAREAGPS